MPWKAVQFHTKKLRLHKPSSQPKLSPNCAHNRLLSQTLTAGVNFTNRKKRRPRRSSINHSKSQLQTHLAAGGHLPSYTLHSFPEEASSQQTLSNRPAKKSAKCNPRLPRAVCFFMPSTMIIVVVVVFIWVVVVLRGLVAWRPLSKWIVITDQAPPDQKRPRFGPITNRQ